MKWMQNDFVSARKIPFSCHLLLHGDAMTLWPTHSPLVLSSPSGTLYVHVYVQVKRLRLDTEWQCHGLMVCALFCSEELWKALFCTLSIISITHRWIFCYLLSAYHQNVRGSIYTAPTGQITRFLWPRVLTQITNHEKGKTLITKILMYSESVDSRFHAALGSCRECFTC